MQRLVVWWLTLVLKTSLLFVQVGVKATEPTALAQRPKDIVLVLDNSGSMNKNDPDFLVKKALGQFVRQVSSDTRLGILIFDEVAKLAVPLTPLGGDTRDAVLARLEQLDYRGRWTNSAAAMEQAMYELMVNSREDATKSIIFLTDGIVDTGDPARDLESTRWLREELAAGAAANGIRIYQIALSDQADFQLLQSLAQKTRGNYFRALQAEYIPHVLDRIQTAILREATRTQATRPGPEGAPERPTTHAMGPATTPQAVSMAKAPVTKPTAESQKGSRPRSD